MELDLIRGMLEFNVEACAEALQKAYWNHAT
jgi:hypothetical protein